MATTRKVRRAYSKKKTTNSVVSSRSRRYNRRSYKKRSTIFNIPRFTPSRIRICIPFEKDYSIANIDNSEISTFSFDDVSLCKQSTGVLQALLSSYDKAAVTGYTIVVQHVDSLSTHLTNSKVPETQRLPLIRTDLEPKYYLYHNRYGKTVPTATDLTSLSRRYISKHRPSCKFSYRFKYSEYVGSDKIMSLLGTNLSSAILASATRSIGSGVGTYQAAHEIMTMFVQSPSFGKSITEQEQKTNTTAQFRIKALLYLKLSSPKINNKQFHEYPAWWNTCLHITVAQKRKEDTSEPLYKRIRNSGSDPYVLSYPKFNLRIDDDADSAITPFQKLNFLMIDFLPAFTQTKWHKLLQVLGDNSQALLGRFVQQFTEHSYYDKIPIKMPENNSIGILNYSEDYTGLPGYKDIMEAIENWISFGGDG